MTLILMIIQLLLWWGLLLGITAVFGKKRIGIKKTKKLLVVLALFLLAITIGTIASYCVYYIDQREIVQREIVKTMQEKKQMTEEIRRNTGMRGFWIFSPMFGIGGEKFRLIQTITGTILLAIAYIMAFYKKGELTFYILQVIVMILLPIIGPIFFILSWMFQKLFFSKKVNLRELSFRKDRLHSILHPDEEKERNVVPVKEALLVSDTQDKRRVMLNVLKGEYEKSLTVITDALENPDTEISHYAASVITEVKSHFKLTVQTMQEQLKDYPDDPAMKVMLIQYIHEFLGKNVLSDIEAMTYITIYLNLMEELFLQDQGSITGVMYKDMIYHLMESKKKDTAEIWAKRALEYAPAELESYKGVLKYYYEIGNKDVFYHIMQQLKTSDVILDKQTLEMVRFFK